MAANKAFKSIDTDIITSSDFTRAKKQLTKYKTIEKAVAGKFYDKLNKWDKNVRIGYCSEACGDEESCDFPTTAENENILISTFSYEDLLDITKGKKYANPILNGSTNSDTNLYIGPFANVTFGPIPEDPCNDKSSLYNKYIFLYPYNTETDTDCDVIDNCITDDNANKILFPNYSQMDDSEPWGTIASPGYLFDPYGKLAENDCAAIYISDESKVKKRRSATLLDFRWLIEYWQVVKGNSLNQFEFPSKINFNQQYTCFSPNKATSTQIQALAPLPNMVTNNEVNAKTSNNSCLSKYQYMYWKEAICNNI